MDLVRQYDGLGKKQQLVSTVTILENLVLKQKSFAFGELKTLARYSAHRQK